MKKYKIHAIHERRMDKFLESLHLLKPLEEGRLKCSICGRQVNKENLQSIYPFKNKIMVCCDDPECYREVLKRKESE